jgi:hypothetical protein
VPVGTVVREIRQRPEGSFVHSHRVVVRRMSQEEIEEATERLFVAHPEYEAGGSATSNAQFQGILESLLKEEQRAAYVARHRESITIDLNQSFSSAAAKGGWAIRTSTPWRIVAQSGRLAANEARNST